MYSESGVANNLGTILTLLIGLPFAYLGEGVGILHHNKIWQNPVKFSEIQES